MTIKLTEYVIRELRKGNTLSLDDNGNVAVQVKYTVPFEGEKTANGPVGSCEVIHGDPDKISFFPLDYEKHEGLAVVARLLNEDDELEFIEELRSLKVLAYRNLGRRGIKSEKERTLIFETILTIDRPELPDTFGDEELSIE